MIPLVEVSSKVVQQKLEIQIKAPSNHHINLKAPVRLNREAGTQYSPLQLNSHQVTYLIETLESAVYQLILYLCNDAKTYCKKQKVTIHWNSKTSTTQVTF